MDTNSISKKFRCCHCGAKPEIVNFNKDQTGVYVRYTCGRQVSALEGSFKRDLRSCPKATEEV